jgi:eukaryotic-like serine/threonine-protein kinase
MRFRTPAPENVVPNEGSELQVSPDGREMALPATGPDGVTQVWIRSIDSLEVRPLSGSKQEGLPFFWSLDSRYIAFSTSGKLKKISISGGPPEMICDLPRDELGGTWNRYGVIVVGQVPGPLMRVSANGGRPVPLTVVDSSRGEALHAFPSFLPDGNHFIYLRASTIVGKSGVYIGSLDAKPEEQDSNQLVATDFSPAYAPSSDPGWGYVLFLRDGTLLAQRFDNRRLKLSGEPATVAEHVGSFRARASFSVSSNGVLSYHDSGPTGSQPVWLNQHGQVSATIGEPGAYESATLSGDGETLAVTQFSARSPSPGIGLIRFAIGTDNQFTFGAAAEHPVWSSDGMLIAFESIRDGIPGVYKKHVSGAKDEELLLKSNQEEAPTSWSRDGRFLLYTSF